MTWYDLEKSTNRIERFNSIVRVVDELKVFIEKSAYSSASLARYNNNFAKAWDLRGRQLASAFRTTKPTFVRDQYAGIGMFLRFSGTGSLFSYRDKFDVICAPLVWWLEDNSCLSIENASNSSGQWKDLAGRSSSLSKGRRFDKFSD